MASARPQTPSVRTKRSWLYTGMAVDPGVALARPIDRTPRLITPVARPRDIVLVGDGFARGLAPTLAKLASDHGGRLFVPSGPSLPPDARAGALVLAGGPHDALWAWLQQGRRMGLVMVLAPPPGLMDEHLRARARAAGARVAPTARTQVVLGPDGRTPSASGFAALAGVVWTWLR